MSVAFLAGVPSFSEILLPGTFEMPSTLYILFSFIRYCESYCMPIFDVIMFKDMCYEIKKTLMTVLIQHKLIHLNHSGHC